MALLAVTIGGDAWAQSFQDALASAYQSNPQLLAARRQLNGTDENVPQALSGWRPRVTINTVLGTNVDQENIDPQHNPERRVPQDYTLQLTQPLYNNGQTSAQVAAARQQVLAERANLLATESTVLLSSGTAYLDVLRDQQALALQQSNARLLRNTLQAAQQQYHAGAITRADFAQAEARSADALASLATAGAQLAASVASFVAQIGLQPQHLALPPLATRLPTTAPQAEQIAETADFRVQRAQHLLQASQRQVDVARGALGPHLSLQGRLERARETEIQRLGQSDNIAQATLNLDLPLYQGGEEYSRIRQAKEFALRDQNVLDSARRDARQRAATAWQAFAAANERIVQQKRAVSANAIALGGITAQQVVGARTLLDVLNQQLELLSSRLGVVSAEHDQMVATLQLMAALGTLTAQQLHLTVTPFDPETHFRAVHEQWAGTTPP